MRPKWIVVFAIAVLIGVFGLVAVMYGLAKVASAEPKQRTDVLIPSKDKEIVAVDPADPAMREFGFKAASVGVVCLIFSGVGIVFSMRPKH
jgi:hypothetical protein